MTRLLQPTQRSEACREERSAAASYQNQRGRCGGGEGGREGGVWDVGGGQNTVKRKRLKERSADFKGDGWRGSEGIYGPASHCACTREGAQLGEKRGNGLQMLCIKHRGLNFNRYVTTRSPAALPFPNIKTSLYLSHPFSY